jgi:2-C-methyl-D-erythritol 2,4-cyclodiphosphate synthase
VGQGFDVHALVPGRRLVIGGVEIPYERGLLGHSDADVLLHAITDAVLGAAGLGNIGLLFPDDDEQHRGADSRALLRTAMARVREAGWRVENIDATVVAEHPKIAPHVSTMCGVIAECTGADPTAVNIKGKTAEKLGALGRNEGIAAHAVVLLARTG